MKWINGYTREEKQKQRKKWHKWFAWFPVVVGLTKKQRQIKIWLQNVERKSMYYDSWDGGCYIHKYRELGGRDEKLV